MQPEFGAQFLARDSAITEFSEDTKFDGGQEDLEDQKAKAV